MTDANRDHPDFIDADTVRRLTPMPALIAALHAAFAARTELPPRQVLGLPDDGSLLIMPAWQQGGDIGVKVVTILPQARPAVKGTYLLMDGKAGGLKAILDGTMLTLRRTAAVSALVADKLARRDARTLLMIGTGALAPHLVEGHAAVRELDRVLIWGRDAARAASLADSLSRAGIAAIATDDLDGAVQRADIVSAATLATAPLIKGRLLKPGSHLDLVGAYLPEMSEADPACFEGAMVCVDSRAAARVEAGDILQAVEAGSFALDDIAADLNELCRGTVAGRPDDRRTTIFKSVGLSIEDLVAAELVYGSLQAG